MTKKLYIIAGPNGSGKTTLAKELVKEDKIAFLNAVLGPIISLTRKPKNEKKRL